MRAFLSDLTLREKFLVYLASFSLFLYVSVTYFISPIIKTISDERRYYAELVEKKAALSAYKSAAATIEESIAEAESKNRHLASLVAEAEHNLFNAGHEKSLMSLLEKFSSETRISLTNLKSSDHIVVKKLDEEESVEYKVREITIRLVCGYFAMGELLERLSSLPVRLENIDITSIEKNQAISGEITLKIFSL